MIKAERINEFEIKVTVDDVVFICDDFLFEDETSLVDMLQHGEGQFPEERAKALAKSLQKQLLSNE